ncbi:MAG: hypothetical protein JXA60_10435 [Candidatus Coatesbacteria bacterium]|nr:hypothetical protein [Candidatus Coatesbacteria bacterium]
MKALALYCADCKSILPRIRGDIWICEKCGKCNIISESKIMPIETKWINIEEDINEASRYCPFVRINLGKDYYILIPLSIHPFNFKIIIKFTSRIFPFNKELKFDEKPPRDIPYFASQLNLAGLWSIIPFIARLNKYGIESLVYNPEEWQLLHIPFKKNEANYKSSIIPWDLTDILISREKSLQVAINKGIIDRELLRTRWNEKEQIQQNELLQELFKIDFEYFG